MALHEHVEVERVEIPAGRISESGDVPRRDRFGHPLHEPFSLTLVGMMESSEALERFARQRFEQRIANAEKAIPRHFVAADEAPAARSCWAMRSFR